ncbi:MAG: DNA repair protein RadA [Bacteroidetes bacterium HGW-Bacteroidetes-13]|nr:MAG: DNA repair protein RadA [Bacteroidetes bacterium HGW-Bacteroidetes-13]
MAKIKTAFFCQNCGTQFAKWQGQCNSCKEWNTIVEELIHTGHASTSISLGTSSPKLAKPQRITEISTEDDKRLSLPDNELNRVLGGGLVSGSVVLLGGEPGIGKSTLLLQTCLELSVTSLYISGEESIKQIKMRADRIHAGDNNCYVLAETQLENIFEQIVLIQPGLIIIDSIQTLQTEYLEATAGSVSQIKECTSRLIKVAKETGIPVILVGHITKDGSLAGPKILEHMVDTVLQFEGDRNHLFRILRSLKNRFGATSEIGIYEMEGSGLRAVENPSEILISKHQEALSGIAIASIMEGLRPLMIEIQALVSTAVYGTPQRSSTGFNARRLNMLLAVLEKRAGFKLAAKDVFLNITGGMTVNDPATDLAVLAAILSSDFDLDINKKYCFAAEVGLAGEVRPVTRVEQRIQEAEKLGFTDIFISKQCRLSDAKYRIKIHQHNKIQEVFRDVFKQ